MLDVTWLPMLCVVVAASQAAAAEPKQLPDRWPTPTDVADISGQPITFPSHSPFVLTDIGPGMEQTQAMATLFVPEGASAAHPVPAVVLLHGAGGILAGREATYARQFASMGVAALVVDTFNARRDRWDSFISRLLNVTESMMMADAYAALAYLAGRPEIDRQRIALMGFSYGTMATTYAVRRTVADRLAPAGLSFSAHIAFYGPCIAQFSDVRTTGAPVLMAMGQLDRIIDVDRCRAVADELQRGGSHVEMVVYDDAYHQWDGRPGADWSPPRGLARCRLQVMPDGRIRDESTRLTMSGYLTRATILGLCSDSDGYRVRTDDAVRERSNALVSRFLNRVWWEGAGTKTMPG